MEVDEVLNMLFKIKWSLLNKSKQRALIRSANFTDMVKIHHLFPKSRSNNSYTSLSVSRNGTQKLVFYYHHAFLVEVGSVIQRIPWNRWKSDEGISFVIHLGLQCCNSLERLPIGAPHERQLRGRRINGDAKSLDRESDSSLWTFRAMAVIASPH